MYFSLTCGKKPKTNKQTNKQKTNKKKKKAKPCHKL